MNSTKYWLVIIIQCRVVRSCIVDYAVVYFVPTLWKCEHDGATVDGQCNGQTTILVWNNIPTGNTGVKIK